VIATIKNDNQAKDNTVALLLSLKYRLDQEGYQTSWDNPFFRWLRPDDYRAESPISAMPSVFFVSGISLPRVAPFDFVSAKISIDIYYIYMTITFHFYTVQIGADQKEQFDCIYVLHDECWQPQLVKMMNPVLMKYSLKWNVEYDETIEDDLYDNFPLSDTDKILAILEDVKNLQLPTQNIPEASPMKT